MAEPAGDDVEAATAEPADVEAATTKTAPKK